MAAQFLEQIFNGVIIGSSYALIALGLSLLYGVLGIINFAHGELYMLGAYLAFFLVAGLHMAYFPALICVFVAGLLFGILLNRVVFQPLQARPKIYTLISSLGLSIFLSNGALLLFGSTPLFLKVPFSQRVVSVLGIQVSLQRLLVVVVASIFILGTLFYLDKTRFGKAIRAVSESEEAASLMGINPTIVKSGTCALATALAGISGALFAPLFIINPFIGTLAGLKAFAVVIVGGFGSIRGTAYAALLLGIAESLATGFVSSAYRDAIAFAILLLALIIRPRGIVKEVAEESI